MRIGILTLPLHSNYGGILQAYALQTVLERQGHDVVVFQNDYDGLWHIPFWKMPMFILKRTLRKCFVDKSASIFIEKKVRKEQSVIRQNTERFIKDYIHTLYVKSLNDIPIAEFNAIVVGSDQIWRAEYVRRMWQTCIQDAYLKFAKSVNLKRVAYAASFGKEDWTYTEEETEECAQLAKLFNGISVREESGIELCSKYLEVNAMQVLDPTLLLNKDDYLALIERQRDRLSQSTGTLFSYILDDTPEKESLISRIAEQNKMIPFTIKISGNDSLVAAGQRIAPPVESWLRGFAKAELVVTDSFHGCIFSIIFRKPFIALGNSKRGMSRFISLLKMFNLEDHLLFDESHYPINKSYAIPEEVDGIIYRLGLKSTSFLFSSLK